jgi:acylphosphatase
MAKSRVKLIIKGIVQGVSFRYYTQREARKYGVGGWVRNLPDGSVAALFEGEEEDIEAMIQWCRQGPPGARVTGVIVQPDEYQGEFQSFSVTF